MDAASSTAPQAGAAAAVAAASASGRAVLPTRAAPASAFSLTRFQPSTAMPPPSLCFPCLAAPAALSLSLFLARTPPPAAHEELAAQRWSHILLWAALVPALAPPPAPIPPLPAPPPEPRARLPTRSLLAAAQQPQQLRRLVCSPHLHLTHRRLHGNWPGVCAPSQMARWWCCAGPSAVVRRVPRGWGCGLLQMDGRQEAPSQAPRPLQRRATAPPATRMEEQRRLGRVLHCRCRAPVERPSRPLPVCLTVTSPPMAGWLPCHAYQADCMARGRLAQPAPLH
mgnify:CR=1 FL=1